MPDRRRAKRRGQRDRQVRFIPPGQFDEQEESGDDRTRWNQLGPRDNPLLRKAQKQHQPPKSEPSVELDVLRIQQERMKRQESRPHKRNGKG